MPVKSSHLVPAAAGLGPAGIRSTRWCPSCQAGPMGWTFTADPESYAARVMALLSRQPERNTLALTVLETLLAGQRFGPGPLLLGWYEAAGQVTGAISMTPPYGILLAELPDGSERELVDRLRADEVAVPDVIGTVAEARRFADCWVAGGSAPEVVMRHQLYRLDRLRLPAPWPAGSARLAGVEELELVLAWMRAFRDEVEPAGAVPDRRTYQRRVELGLIWFWLDRQGNPVSMAGRNVTVAGTSRVGPVYTPPARRGHGYAAAVTAACTRDALDRGALQVVLFTDLMNPTSNGVYQRLGYQPVEERVILRFVE